MSGELFEFYVSVEVEIDIPEGDQRTPEDYAHAALNAASLRDARSLDGFADLTGKASIDDVMLA